jgi:hypothetical protein
MTGSYSVLEIPDRYVRVRVYFVTRSPPDALVQRAQGRAGFVADPSGMSGSRSRRRWSIGQPALWCTG